LVVDALTPHQATVLAGAGDTYANIMRGLSPSERDAVRSGQVKLADIHTNRHTTDAMLDGMLIGVGYDRWLATVDRATQPSAVAAE
jgi:hypothetical protein